MPTFGIEEEVFVVEGRHPSPKAMLYLTRLLWQDPRRNYSLTASNFSRGKDLFEGVMSGVEIATRVHGSAADALDDLAGRRQELASVTDAMLVPIGHLLDLDSPTNTCALHVHVGNVTDTARTLRNFIYFLPVLTLLTVNSPCARAHRVGQSYRIMRSFALGPLRDDPYYRFQDVIISRRLGTIELRVFDPTWDPARLRVLLGCIEAISRTQRDYHGRIEEYNELRHAVAARGYVEELERVFVELNDLYPVPKHLLTHTCSDVVWLYSRQEGIERTYSGMDNAYRTGVFEPTARPAQQFERVGFVAGLAGYYVPKLPYIAWKAWREWH
ncbi:MAG: hypothetical protein C4521_00690 [Actinobacteria bacterium]|nr:MAG: hypothetical protein C4521_00690 [Actinomycetota bacterium]